MKIVKYLTAFSVFSILIGLIIPASAITLKTTLVSKDSLLGFSSCSSPCNNAFFRKSIIQFDWSTDLMSGTGTVEDINDLTFTVINDNGIFYADDAIINGKAQPIDEARIGGKLQPINDIPRSLNDITFNFDLDASFDSDSVITDFRSSDSLFGAPKGTQFLYLIDNTDVAPGNVGFEFKVVEYFRTGATEVNNGRIESMSTSDTLTQPVPFEAEGTMGVVALGGYLFYRHRKKNVNKP